MNLKFVHPLWTHIPAVLALLAGVVFTIIASPLPDPAPLHFTLGGQPDRYGSPWVSAIWQAGLSIMYIILSIVIDEAWARQEKRKTFNWLSLFDDVTVAALAAVQITYVLMLASSNSTYVFPWALTLGAAALAAVIAIILEKMRPFRSYQSSLTIEDASQVKDEVIKLVKSGRPLAYWEVQNPAYSRFLAIVIPIIMLVVAVTAWSEVPWLSILMALIGLALALIYGGFRTAVTKEFVTVRMGMFGLRLLSLKIPDISSAEPHSFLPLKDFGGYGIRFNKEMKAYYLKGNRGVKITTRGGQKYLIGSDHPERLSAVISAVKG
jgi:hypothetical protein